jgi:RHS repeat-associated protein
MLDDLGLVHMNGRIYDPMLGRMLSPDAMVQFPNDLQSYNRYSYVRNNPLTVIDPTGFYEAAGHFYTPFILAIAAGMPPERAFKIAYYSQYPDQHRETSAYRGPISFVFDSIFHHRRLTNAQVYLHSLNGKRGVDVDHVRTALHDVIANKNVSDETRGIAAHPFGDAFAHTKEVSNKDESGTVTSTVVAYKAGFGHASDGTAPDVLSNRKELFKEYATSLADALSEASGKTVDKEVMTKLFSTVDGLKAGGNEPNADDKALRELAVSLGYNDNYKPEQGQSEVSDKFPNLTKAQIQDAIKTIKDAIEDKKKKK